MNKTQFSICLSNAEVRIKFLKNKITELEGGYEQLRIAALHAVCKIGGGQAKADLRDAYDKATEQLEMLEDNDK
jgi:hypothetical protein